jgi:tetratricopeptide (TPR) repeat protein
MKKLQIFISSPGDVFEERAIAQRVIERLQSEYVGRVVLEPVLWEHEPLVASSTFQDQIVRPSETDIVVSILWSRLGTRLPKGFTRADGSRFDSGTEYEFEDAIAGFRKNGKPDLLVYRKTAPPSVRLDDEKELLERLQQKKKLDEFVTRWFHDQTEGTLTAAFHMFDSPSDFENALEAHLHKLVERKLPETLAAAGEAPAVWKKGSPFRGLHAFEFEHAPVFFGRTKAVSDVLQALRNQAVEGRAFVLILGMSGGGKSSVVRAGVLPMLTQPGVIEGVALWRRAVFRPGDTPGDLFTGLASAILREHGLPTLDADNEGPTALAGVLRDSPQSAVMLIKSALDQAAAQSAGGKAGKLESRLALVVDQMEEMFTQEDVTSRDRKAFVHTLDVLARCGRIWIIGTLRSDFYPRLAELPVLGALKEGDGQYDLMPPVASEIGQMIRLPTRAAGLRFEEDPSSSERLDDMLRDAAAEHPEVLPLLQFTLEELYQRRTSNGTLTLEAYRELGGVEGSLAQRAETVFEALPPEVQAALPKVLNALVSIEQDGHETIGRKRAPWHEATNAEVRMLLETFVAARLFVTELGDDGSVVVTVAHEALLWHWPRVREWVDQNRENLRIRSRISTAADRWAHEQRPSDLLLPRGKPLGEAETLLEQDIDLDATEAEYIGASIARAKRAQRMRGGVVATLALMAVMAGSAAFLANEQRHKAIEAQNRAEVDAETAKRTTEFIVDLFKVSDPSEALGNTITAREILTKGAERIAGELADQAETRATLMNTMGTVYTSLGLYKEAVPLLESSLETRREVLGPGSLEVAASMDHLAEVRGQLGEFAAAHDLYEQAFDVRTRAGSADSPEAAISLSGMAEMLMEQGEYALAEPLYVEALDMRRQHLGDTHPLVAESLRKLGLNYFYKGEFEKSEAQLREAVRMRRELHGAVHPDLANALNDLAWALFELDALDETEALWREALDMQIKLYGDNTPQVALALNNVALVNSVRGDLEGAEELYRRAIDVQRSSVGESHPNLAMFTSNLAALLYEKGDSEAAVDAAKQALDLRRRLLRGDHPQVADGAAMVAYWSMQLGNYEEAESLLDESLRIREKTLGEQHPDVASALTLKAGVLLATRRFEEAQKTAHDARLILEASFPGDHWRVAAAANAEGAALVGLGKFEEAEQLLLPSNEILAGAPMPGVAEQSRQRLATLYAAWGRRDQAQKYLTN